MTKTESFLVLFVELNVIDCLIQVYILVKIRLKGRLKAFSRL